jgi:hypothetical protein
VRRRVGVALAAGALALAVVPTAATWAAGDATGPVAAVSQGWWNQVGPPASAEPVTALVPLPSPPAVDVPEGAVPVAMRLGQPQRVGAIGMTMETGPGAEVRRLVLHLKESTDSGGQQGSGAAVRACPITDFLVPEDGGDAANTPAADCTSIAADGVRAEDGTWSFDLTAIGQAWASGALTVNGIRLDPVGEAPATFQVAFTGVGDARLEQDVTVTATSDPFASSGGGAFSTDAFSSDSFSSGSFDAGASGLGAVESSPAPPAVAPSPRTPARETVSLASSSDDERGFTDSALSVALLAAALLGLGAAVAWSQGGAARAVTVPVRRSRGVAHQLVRRQGASRPHA